MKSASVRLVSSLRVSRSGEGIVSPTGTSTSPHFTGRHDRRPSLEADTAVDNAAVGCSLVTTLAP